jgi:4-amino-4-deoxy-L-arabinose transferase-like glycosyltransferase
VKRLVRVARMAPAAARWCALVAFVNTVVWAIITPPFHVPDETGHVVYVQHLAETGTVPIESGADPFSPELHAFLRALRFGDVVGRSNERAVLSEYYDSGIRSVMDDPPSPVGPGGHTTPSSQPPLYYAVEAGVYLASPWQDLLHRVWLMRLVSALCAAATTLFAFMFLRELGGPPWAWTVGSLAIAFQPLFGFVSSGVHPDSLMVTAAAALFFGLARGFRRGLTPRLGFGIGLALAVGSLTKLNFLTLVPGALIAVAILALRPQAARGPALRGAATSLSVLAVAAVVFVALNTLVFDRPASGRVDDPSSGLVATGTQATAPITRAEQLSYTWQLYLPRLPFMNDQFAYYPLYETYFKGAIGLFGWLDTPFPRWVYPLALFIVLPLVALSLVALLRRRQLLLRRWPELLAYAAMAFGLLVSIGLQGISYRRNEGYVFEQARYLLPLLPLYGAALALAARGAGARFERALAAGIVTLAMAHGLFAQLLVISRFYG